MAEKNLEILLASMNPSLHEDDFVFATVEENALRTLSINPLCTFREEEGMSLIVEKSIADRASLDYTGLWSFITCKINSDLNAIGFLAAIANALAKDGIALNPVSAFFHDHLFVPKERAQDAMSILRDLSRNTQDNTNSNDSKGNERTDA